MYGATSLASHFPRSQTPKVTAGLKWAPEICPPAKIITMSAEPIANGANAPAPLPITVHPMVRTRKKLPLYYHHAAQLSSAALNRAQLLLSIVSEARRGKARARARCVRVLSIHAIDE